MGASGPAAPREAKAFHCGRLERLGAISCIAGMRAKKTCAMSPAVAGPFNVDARFGNTLLPNGLLREALAESGARPESADHLFKAIRGRAPSHSPQHHPRACPAGLLWFNVAAHPRWQKRCFAHVMEVRVC